MNRAFHFTACTELHSSQSQNVHISSISVYGFINKFLLKYKHMDRSENNGADKELWPHSYGSYSMRSDSVHFTINKNHIKKEYQYD